MLPELPRLVALIPESRRIELPRKFRSFDYDTISDVVLHLKYTSRRDGTLAEPAQKALQAELDSTGNGTLFHLFSLRGVVVLDDAIYPAIFLEPDEDLGTALQLFRKSRKPMDIAAATASLAEADAYKVQFAVHDRMAAGGDRIAGWKVALTLPHQYEPLKLSGPVFAGIYQSGLRQSGAQFEKGWPIKAGIEPE